MKKLESTEAAVHARVGEVVAAILEADPGVSVDGAWLAAVDRVENERRRSEYAQGFDAGWSAAVRFMAAGKRRPKLVPLETKEGRAA